ncbi:MAG TPA: archaellin/type IV pilin N-terminal domain-containing protein [Methanoregula sp.]|nr:archaellin/type IV pilin N-terminal domain-containing protein [Methanoregula sp.]
MEQNTSDAFTGLEAAIVLIAFVVVAAVFSYVVLGAGFFTTQKAQEAVYKSVEQSTSNLLLIGNVYGLSTDNVTITEIRFSIGLAPGASDTDLTKLKVVFSTPSTTPVILTHGSTSSQTVFTAKEGGAGPSLSSMTQNQQSEIAFNVTPVPVNTKINIEIRPGVGAALPFSKTTPATITTTNVLS